MNIQQEQNNSSNKILQPRRGESREVRKMPRHERWDRSKAEVEALPSRLLPHEFKVEQRKIWAKWGL